MRKYRFIPGAGVLALALIAMMNEDVPAVIGLILIIAAAILLIFASRGTVYFSKAVRAINSSEPGKKEKGVELMEKALKAGLSDENAVVAASVLLQNDNEEKAKEILEPLSMSKERKVAGPALSSLSMYYWLQKDYAKAIDAYKMSLRNNPLDDETRYNLALAQKLLKDQQQQQNQNQNKQDQNKKQDKQQQDQQQQQNQNKQKDQQQNDKQQSPSKSNQKDSDMSKENAEQLLNSVMQDEKNVQDKIKKQLKATQGGTLEKDW